MKKDKILIIVFGLSIVVFVLIFVVPIINYKKNLENQLIKVPYANQEISSGEVVYANMISYKVMKISEFSDDYIRDIDSLVGKCVKDNILIEEGNFFAENYIEECE